jgi:hypothetical protein
LAAALLAAACGGGDSDVDDGAAPQKTAETTTTTRAAVRRDTPKGLLAPRPVDVDLALDASRQVTVPMGRTGGTAVVFASDGTTFTLTIPDGALLENADITLTPVSGVDGFDFGTATALGVDVGPDGLRLVDVATLTVAPAAGAGPVAAAFAYEGDGKQFRLQPIADGLDPAVVPVTHFSGVVVAVGEWAGVGVEVPEFAPEGWHQQIRHETAALLQAERAAHLGFGDANEDLDAELSDLFDRYWNKVIEPMLLNVAADCEFSRAHGLDVNGWLREGQLLGMLNDDDPRVLDATTAIVEGMKTCFDELTEPCWATGDPAVRHEVLSLWRTLTLLGVEDDRYNPFKPSSVRVCESSGIVVVDGTVAKRGSGYYRVDFSWNEKRAVWSADVRAHFPATEDEGEAIYRAKGEGSGSVSVTDVPNGTSFNLHGGRDSRMAVLFLIAEDGTYDFSFQRPILLNGEVIRWGQRHAFHDTGFQHILNACCTGFGGKVPKGAVAFGGDALITEKNALGSAIDYWRFRVMWQVGLPEGDGE